MRLVLVTCVPVFKEKAHKYLMSCGGKCYEGNWVRWQRDRKLVIGNRENKAHTQIFRAEHHKQRSCTCRTSR